MSKISIRFLLLFLLLSFLVGCQTSPTKNYPSVEVEDLSVSALEQQDKLVKKAIFLLGNGKTNQATILIDRVLFLNRNHKTAVSLKKQLTQTANDFFNTSRFANYKIKKGDTLGGIANEWLGDQLFFVSLAKLNNIDSPENLKSGITIKIPVIHSSKIIAKEIIRSEKNLKLLQKDFINKDFLIGLKKINSLFVVKQHSDKFNNIQSKLLTGYEESATSIIELEIMIEQCQLLLNSNKIIEQKIRLQDSIKKQQQLLLVKKSDLFFKEENYIDSIENLIQAKKTGKDFQYPKNILKSTEELEEKLIDKLHERAIIHYRNQELNEALKIWVLISNLQPDNELSNKYIQRTNKLIKKLNKY